MNPVVLSVAFAVAVLASLLVKFWLTARQVRHVAAHRASVPAAFAGIVSIEAHQKAADYTIAKLRFGLVGAAFGNAVLIGWTLLGGLGALDGALRDVLGLRWHGLAYELALIAAFSVIGSLLDMPFDLYGQFRLEERFGFNKMTIGLYVVDALKSLALGIVIGLPLMALVLWIMQATGSAWWIWAWGTLTAFQLVAMVVYPKWIAPLFNKFEPLADETLVARVSALMVRCGFKARGFFVMDGSKRSGHSNAYFTGLGNAKRVVFYDTLMARLTADELEAVLAHELGHFKHRHILKRSVMMFVVSFAAFALLGWLATQVGFYLGLGVAPNLTGPNDALALLLFMLALPSFTFFIAPVFSSLSRRDEFEADAFARSNASATDLVRALLKLHEDNAGTLTSDPIYVRYYYSHPPTLERIEALGVSTRDIATAGVEQLGAAA